MGTSNKFGDYSSAEDEEQPKGSVNVYVGMFFDGTGNNRNNSDKTYYSYVKGNGYKIIAKSIPSDFSYTKTMATDEGGKKKK